MCARQYDAVFVLSISVYPKFFLYLMSFSCQILKISFFLKKRGMNANMYLVSLC